MFALMLTPVTNRKGQIDQRKMLVVDMCSEQTAKKKKPQNNFNFIRTRVQYR